VRWGTTLHENRDNSASSPRLIQREQKWLPAFPAQTASPAGARDVRWTSATQTAAAGAEQTQRAHAGSRTVPGDGRRTQSIPRTAGSHRRATLQGAAVALGTRFLPLSYCFLPTQPDAPQKPFPSPGAQRPGAVLRSLFPRQSCSGGCHAARPGAARCAPRTRCPPRQPTGLPEERFWQGSCIKSQLRLGCGFNTFPFIPPPPQVISNIYPNQNRSTAAARGAAALVAASARLPSRPRRRLLGCQEPADYPDFPWPKRVWL